MNVQQMIDQLSKLDPQTEIKTVDNMGAPVPITFLTEWEGSPVVTWVEPGTTDFPMTDGVPAAILFEVSREVTDFGDATGMPDSLHEALSKGIHEGAESALHWLSWYVIDIRSL